MSENTAIRSSKIARLKNFIKTIALILIVLFAIAPVIMAALPNSESNQTYSIYNTGYDGFSIIRNDIENVREGNTQKFEAINIISNLNVLNRFNGSGVLFISGPAADFELTETISVILYLLRGGSVVIADDFGTGNQILDPIFSAFENMDKFSQEATNLGFEVPSVTDIFSGGGGSTDNTTASTPDPTDPANFIEGGSSQAAGEISDSFMTNLIGDVILRFAFNNSGVLMDIESNNNNPVRPIITEIDHTDLSFGNDKYTYTSGVEKIQMEMATIISVKVRTNSSQINPDTGKIEYVVKDAWQPLQKLSTALITGDEQNALELDLPFFPFYSSKLSWIETDIPGAAAGTAEPDANEWGNAKFATALTIPLFPGFGKLIFIADPSIFINRWTADTVNNDNLLLFRNLIEMATFTQEVGVDADGNSVPIPVIFDFGHTFQGLLSPALYSTALMKLIAEMSMFPLYAPFVPLAAYGYGKRLMPGTRRLRPILLTKRRGEKGHSDFERKLEDIKLSGGYGEPIMHLTRRLVRTVQSDVRFTGLFAKNPKEMARFFTENYPSVGSRRELQSQLSAIFKIADNPTRRMNLISAKKYLGILKKLLEYLG